MVDKLKAYWPYLVIAVLTALLLYNYLRPTPAQRPIGRKQTKQIKAELTKKGENIKQATAAADRANAASDASYTLGQAADARAQQNRINTHRRYATPTPTTDTAAARIQRALSNY